MGNDKLRKLLSRGEISPGKWSLEELMQEEDTEPWQDELDEDTLRSNWMKFLAWAAQEY